MHYKHAFVGMFGVFETRGKKGNTPNNATWGVFSMFGVFGVFGTSMLGLYRAWQWGEEDSRVGEGGRGTNGAFLTCSGAVLSGS